MSWVKDSRRMFTNLGIIVFIVISSFIIAMQSTIAPWSNTLLGIDGSVFETIGFLMTKGFVPYRDSFDHKGPLIYIINWFGMQLSYYSGVWVIEFLAIILTLFFMYKIARMVCGNICSCITLFAASSILFGYFNGGNFVEEYAMPFIAVSLYYFLDYFLNDMISIPRLIICGISFGSVCMLRVNMIAVWVCFCIAVLIQLIYKKLYNKLLSFALFFMCGVAMIVLPILIWLAINRALGDFWVDYILFNSMYVSDASRATMVNKFNSFQYFSTNILVLASIVMTSYYAKIKRSYCDFTYLVCLVLTLVWIAMSGMSYNHYGMVLVPLMVYPLANFLDIGNSDKTSANATVVIIWILISISISPWGNAISSVIKNYADREIVSNNIQDIVDLIIEHTDEDDKITVWGNRNIIYLLSRRMPASKYSYQNPIGEVDNRIYEEYFQEIDLNQPKFIIIDPIVGLGRMSEFLKIHTEYNCVGSINEFDIYCNEYIESGIDN